MSGENNMVKDRVFMAVNAMFRLADKDDADVVADLVRNGMPIEDAEFAIAFVPLAFGRALLQRVPSCEGMTFADSVEIPTDSKSESTTLHLDCVPYYSAALALAEQSFGGGGVPKEKFQAAALRSAEVHAVNRALAKTEDMKGSVMAAPILLRLGEVLKAKSVKPAVRPRKWWKLW